MKKALPIMILLLVLSATQASALDLATATIRDVGFTGKFEYAVDIYIVSEGDTNFQVGTTYLTLSYNNSVLYNPTLSEENADIHNSGYYNAMQLAAVAADRTQLQLSPNGAAGTILPDTEIRLARITFTIDDTAYRTQDAGIAWVTALTQTFIHNINNADIWLDKSSESIAGNTSLVCRPAISDTPDLQAPAGQLFSFAPSVADNCNAGPMTYSISGIPGWADFSTTTGELSGTPALADVGNYLDIQISVADSYGDATPMTAFDIAVTDTAPSGDGTGTGSTTPSADGGGGGGCFIATLR